MIQLQHGAIPHQCAVFGGCRLSGSIIIRNGALSEGTTSTIIGHDREGGVERRTQFLQASGRRRAHARYPFAANRHDALRPGISDVSRRQHQRLDAWGPVAVELVGASTSFSVSRICVCALVPGCNRMRGSGSGRSASADPAGAYLTEN